MKYNEIHAALTRTEGVKNFSKVLVNGDVKDIPLDPADYPCTGEITASRTRRRPANEHPEELRP